MINIDTFVSLLILVFCTVLVLSRPVEAGYWQGLFFGLCIGVIATNCFNGEV